MNKHIKRLIAMSGGILLAASLSAATVDIQLVQTDGSTKTLQVDADATRLVLFDSAEKDLKTASVEGLEKLEKLKVLEFQTMAFMKDFSFVGHLVRLEELYIQTGTIGDLFFLEKMTSLRTLVVTSRLDAQCMKTLRTKKLDLSSLTFLTSLTLRPATKIDFVPDLLPASSTVHLSMDNQNIGTFSEADVRILSRFSSVDLSYNPVASKKDELAKLANKGITVRALTKN